MRDMNEGIVNEDSVELKLGLNGKFAWNIKVFSPLETEKNAEETVSRINHIHKLMLASFPSRPPKTKNED